MKTKELTLIGIMAAVTCILGPLSIITPFSPIPISLTNFILYLSIYLLGTRMAAESYLIYLFIGLVGLPVFSGFSSGPGTLLGPTGGYLIGFIFMITIAGRFIDYWPNQKVFSFLGLFLGTAVCYLLGSLWLSKQAAISFSSALTTGVLPFILWDFIKIILVMMIGPQVRQAFNKAGLR